MQRIISILVFGVLTIAHVPARASPGTGGHGLNASLIGTDVEFPALELRLGYFYESRNLQIDLGVGISSALFEDESTGADGRLVRTILAPTKDPLHLLGRVTSCASGPARKVRFGGTLEVEAGLLRASDGIFGSLSAPSLRTFLGPKVIFGSKDFNGNGSFKNLSPLEAIQFEVMIGLSGRVLLGGLAKSGPGDVVRPEVLGDGAGTNWWGAEVVLRATLSIVMLEMRATYLGGSGDVSGFGFVPSLGLSVWFPF